MVAVLGFTGTFVPAATCWGANTATFVETNRTTQGTWKGTYGSDGWWVINAPNNAKSLPAYATVTVSGASTYTWSGSETVPRATQKPLPDTDRLAACWYLSGTFTFDVDVGSGSHKISLYCLDWDSTNRRQTIRVKDGVSGTVLDSRSLTSQFDGGAYLVWAISGHVKIDVVYDSGNNAVISGLFLDPVPSYAPAVTNQPATNVLSASACLNGSLTATGGAPTEVWVYWGTSDGTTNKSSWATNYSLGVQSVTGLTHEVAGLSSNTVYWYAYFGSNGNGEAWAQPSVSFRTQGGAPAVDNDGGAVVLGPYSAALRGTLAGGGSARVWFYCGTDTNLWSSTYDMGVLLEGAFSTNATGLTRNTAYYYSILASNGSGVVSSPVTNFATYDFFLIDTSTNLAPAQSALFSNEAVVVRGSGVVLTLLPHGTYGTLQTYYFGGLTVSNGASVVCRGQTNGPTYDAAGKGVAIQSANDVTVDALSSINADGQGFNGGGGTVVASGPGLGRSGNYTATGCGHGGMGAYVVDGLSSLPATDLPGGTTYGSCLQPLSLGSGSSSAPGGGAVKVVASGTVRVDGKLSACSPTNTDDWTCDGAGGSVWIEAAMLSGAASGRIRADGSTHKSQYYSHGAGGGGRIAVYVATDSFGGAMTAYGGVPQSWGGYGAAGTIYEKVPSQTYGGLTVDNNDFTNRLLGPNVATRLGATNDSASYQFDRLTLRRAGHLQVVGTEILTLTQSETHDGDGRGILSWTTGQGTLVVPSAYTLSNCVLNLNNGQPAGLTDLTLGPGGKVSHWCSVTSEQYRLSLNLNSLTVQPGGAVDVTGKGYTGGYGPGKGNQSVSGYDSTGGSHGGQGGLGGDRAVSDTYGSYATPTNLGTGGSGRPSFGGGSVRVVANTVTVDGDILANGLDSIYDGNGPGSGGSIWITAGTLSGAATGRIAANGASHAASYYNHGGGGGGRVALYVAASTFGGAVQAFGGFPRANGAYGAAGTVFTKLAAQLNGELAVNNRTNSTQSNARLTTGNDPSTYTLDKVMLTASGRLEVALSQKLDVSASTVPIVGDRSGWVVNNGTFDLPVVYAVTNFNLVNNNQATLGGLKDLTIGAGSLLTHSPNSTAEVYRLNLSVRNLTVEGGGRVNADYLGYGPSYGPGRGGDAYTVTGGTYAGVGAFNTNATYGSAVAPTNLGSGGSWNYDTTYGGGAIKLTVLETLLLNGTISASGGNGNSGGGAGGSVWLDTGTLAGTGMIRAVAGTAPAGGGGGRIAIGYAKSSFVGLPPYGLYTNQETISATVLARGGYRLGTNGVEDGSIYIYPAMRSAKGGLFVIY